MVSENLNDASSTQVLNGTSSKVAPKPSAPLAKKTAQNGKSSQNPDTHHVPSNWQRKFSPAENLAGVINIHSAVMVDGSLHDQDGTVYSPDGNYFVHIV